MKVIIAVLITALITSASAFGAASWSHTSNGVWCKTQSGSVACIPLSGKGYGVAINEDAVLVMNISTSKRVFARYQP